MNTTEPVYFQGQQLPPLRSGKVWGMLLYPGGRRELRQYDASQLQTVDAAACALVGGASARVWLDDATMTELYYQQLRSNDDPR